MARVPIKCPPLGVSVFTGLIAEWYVKAGDPVQNEQPLWSVETDKVTQDVLAPSAGVIGEILLEVGEVVEPEQIVGYLHTEGEPVKSGSGGGTAKEAPPAAAPALSVSGNGKSAPAPTPAVPVTAQATVATTARTSPKVRRLMRENQISAQQFASIQGSGRKGRVQAGDIERWLGSGRRAEIMATAPTYAPPPLPQAPTGNGKGAAPAREAASAPKLTLPVATGVMEEGFTVEDLTTIRKTIATHLRHSVDTAVHTVSIDECDVTTLVAMRGRIKDAIEAQYGVKLTFTAFIVKAVALALRDFPRLNARFELGEGKVYLAQHVHIGVAADAPQGLMVPVVKFADQKSLLQLQGEIADLGNRAKEGKLTLDQLQGSTYTVTNAGAQGSIASTPIINPPNVGILGVHKIRRMPVVRDDQIVIRDMVNLSAAFDHRAVDGVYNVRFMNRVIQFLEAPELLLLS